MSHIDSTFASITFSDPQLFVYCCDFSDVAINLVKVKLVQFSDMENLFLVCDLNYKIQKFSSSINCIQIRTVHSIPNELKCVNTSHYFIGAILQFLIGKNGLTDH